MLVDGREMRTVSRCDPISSDVLIEQSFNAIRRRWTKTPLVGIVLGTGLGKLGQELELESDIAYSQIPHFPQATALGHAGRLLMGSIEGLPAVIMDGRFHRYEGYTVEQIAFPIRVMQRMGVRWLLLSNASGGLRPGFEVGDIMVINDHISLAGPIVDHRPNRQPFSCSGVYDESMAGLATEAARNHGFLAHQGVYATMLGPTYETRAEYRFLRKIGADVVGMSTVPEVIAAATGGMRTLALSIVTNVCRPDQLIATDGKSVVDAAARAEWKVRAILLAVLNSLTQPPFSNSPSPAKGR